MFKYYLLMGFCSLFFNLSLAQESIEKPAVMLPLVYQQVADVGRYWISEKLDGVRARWDGKQLVSRGGQVFAAPAWFIADFPDVALDGELWLGRGQFAKLLSVVRKQQAHEGWRQVKFMLFDLPKSGEKFTQRLEQLQTLVAGLGLPHLQVIPQFRLKTHAALLQKLTDLSQQGAEGLMLHAEDALYHSGRSADLFKLKVRSEAYAKVIGYRPGKGKFMGMVGSLRLQTPAGKIFYLSSGLRNVERKNPPKVGSLVQFRYQGLTKNGLPRFAVFLRQRHPLEQ